MAPNSSPVGASVNNGRQTASTSSLSALSSADPHHNHRSTQALVTAPSSVTPGAGTSAPAPPAPITPKARNRVYKKASCAKCSEEVIDYNLKRHIRLRHPEIYSEDLSVADIFRRAGYAWDNAQDSAQDQSTPKGKVRCERCGAFACSNNLKRHIKNKHPEIYDESLTAPQMLDRARGYLAMGGGDQEGEVEDDSDDEDISYDSSQYDYVSEDDKGVEAEDNARSSWWNGETLIEDNRKGWMSFGRD